MKIQPVIIAFNTHGWIQRALRSFFNYYPDRNVVVLDNNPPPDKEVAGRWSYERDRFYFGYGQQERNWLDRQKNLTVIEHPKKNTHAIKHGEALDFVRKWCFRNGIDAMFHFEPDCTFHKAGLLERVSQKLDEGYWLVGVKKIKGGGIWTAGSTWLLDAPVKKFSFMPRPIGYDIVHPRFYEVVPYGQRMGFNKTVWDTGQKIWYECGKEDKACILQDTGFCHEFNSSVKQFVKLL